MAFTSGSKLLSKKWEERKYRLHLEKVRGTKSGLDNTAPKQYPHLILRLKKVQREEERQAAIDHKNHILLQKMTDIMRKKGRVDNWNDYESRSLNQSVREKEQERIAEQNYEIARRLEGVRPVYDVHEWDNEWNRHEYYLDMWANSTKDFDIVSPRAGGERSRAGGEAYEDDFEDDESVHNGQKLPDIGSRESTQSMNAKKEKKDPTYVKLPKIKNKKTAQQVQENRHSYEMYWGDLSDEIDRHQALKRKRNIVLIRPYESKRGRTERSPSRFNDDKAGNNENDQSNTNNKMSSKNFDKEASIKNKEPEDSRQKKKEKSEVKTESEEDAIAENDAKQLFKASKQMAKGDETVLKTLIRRSHAQRMATKYKFEDMYDLDLGEELKRGLGATYAPLIDCLLSERETTDAEAINKAIHKNSASDLVQIICSRNPAALTYINKSYKRRYDVTIENDISSRILDEDCQAFLVALLGTNRQGGEVDDKLAENDAQDLSDSGQGRFSDDNGTFMRLMNERSMPQVKTTFNKYKKVSGGKDLTDAMQDDGCSKEYITAVKTMTRCMNNSSALYAENIQAALKSGDTKSLVNHLLVRAEIDMPEVRKAYKKKFGTELIEDIMKKHDREIGPLIAQIAARAAPGQGKAGGRKGMLVPSPPKKPPMRQRPGTDPVTNVSKDNPLAQPSKKPYALPPTGKKGKGKGTVTPSKTFNVDMDVKRIHEAMQGFGTNEEPLIDILSTRSNAQRQQIRKKYMETYKKPLIDVMESELRGDFEELILALMMTPSEYDAYCLHDAMDGIGTSEAALIGILCTRNAKELKAVTTQYKKNYDQDLAADLKDDTSGDFSELLLQLAKGARDQGDTVDKKLAEKEAKLLHKSRNNAIEVNDGNFREILTKRNKAQMKATFDQYKKLTGNSIGDGIKNAMIGDAEDGYIGLVEASQDPIEFYAKRLVDAMSGIGTNDKQLIRIIVSRSEIDLADIKAKYKELTKKTLGDSVEKECNGDYKKLLLAIINGYQGSTKETGSTKKAPPSSTLKTESETKDKPKGTDSPQKKKSKKKEDDQTSPQSSSNKPAQKQKGKTQVEQVEQESPRAKSPAAKSPERGNIPKRKDPPIRNDSPTREKTPERQESPEKQDNQSDKGDSSSETKSQKDSSDSQEPEGDWRKTEESQDDGYEKKPDTKKEKKIVSKPPSETHGTVVGIPSVDVQEDAEAIKKALDGWNNDEEALINILSKRTNQQRQDIKLKFKENYDKDLEDTLKDELKGDFEEIIIALMKVPVEFDAMCLKDGPKGLGTDEALINGILVSRNAEDLSKIKEIYKKEYERDLSDDLKVDTSGDYQELILQLVKGERDQSFDVDEEEAEEDAKKLYNEGSRALKPNDDVFREVLTKKNKQQVKEIFEHYKMISGEEIEKGIKESMVGDTEDALLALVKCLKDPVTFYAERLRGSMEGLGTNDRMLIRIVVSRSEIDMVEIKEKYKELYSMSLEDSIESECSGDYKRMLLALINDKEPDKEDTAVDLEPVYSEKALSAHSENVNKRSKASNKDDEIKPKQESDEEFQAEDSFWDSDPKRVIPEALPKASVETSPDKDSNQELEEEKHQSSDDESESSVESENKPTEQSKQQEEDMPDMGNSEGNDVKSIGEEQNESLNEDNADANKQPEQKAGTKEPEELPKLNIEKTQNKENEDSEVSEDDGKEDKGVEDETSSDAEDNDGEESDNKEKEEDEGKQEEVTPKPETASGKKSCEEEGDPAKGAKTLYKLISTNTLDDDYVIENIIKKSMGYRQEVWSGYQRMYGRNLITDLKRCLGDDTRYVIHSIMMTPLEYDVVSVKGIMKCLDTDPSVLVEILMTNTAQELQKLIVKYQVMTKHNFVNDLTNNDDPTPLRTFLYKLSVSRRVQRSDDVDNEEARVDAMIVENGLSLKNDVFISLLLKKSYPQLKKTLQEYKSVTGREPWADVNGSNPAEEAAVATAVMLIYDPILYYTARLNHVITHDVIEVKELIRLIVPRSPMELMDIKARYKEQYAATLESEVGRVSAGRTRSYLLEIMKGNMY